MVFAGAHCRACGTMSRGRRSSACNMYRCGRKPGGVPMFEQLNRTGERAMRKSILAITLASTAALGACANNPRVAQDAAIGAAGGAAVGAVVPGVSVIEGAAVGAAIGGLAGAVWSDTTNDGYVDGYTYNGQY